MPLSEITPGNVDQLRASWSFSTGGKLGGLEATPLVRDGVIYISTDYSRVIALDARTGVRKWSFDPEYDAALDAELADGHYRGLPPGIPPGAKALPAVEAYPTPWAAAPSPDPPPDAAAPLGQLSHLVPV